MEVLLLRDELRHFPAIFGGRDTKHKNRVLSFALYIQIVFQIMKT